MKKFLATMLALLMALTLCTAAWADSPSWYDENAAVFELNSADQLAELAALVNAEDGDAFAGKTVKLTADIDLSSVLSWTPIGNGTRSSSHYSGKAFKGTFDGGNHTISNVNNMLFGVLDGGTIKNLVVEANINDTTEDNSVGAVAGIVVGNGTISNITVSGTVSGKGTVGGVVGRVLIEGTVKDCVNSAAITTSGTTNAGGIVGAAYYTNVGKTMTISGCSNSGTVTSGYAAGGIVGFSAADVKNCVNTGAISAGNEAGGIVGEQTNYGTVSGNNNSGTVSNNGGGSSYGGIVGWVRYQKNTSAYPNTTMIEVSDNINSGTVSASGASLGAGGIVGTAYNQALVTGNTNTAANIAGGAFAAGILGGAQMSVRGEADEGNVVLEGQTITVSNNVSTTSIDNISVSNGGECKHLYVWINDPAFSETGNVNHIYTVTFNPNNDDDAFDVPVASGRTVDEPDDPVRNGYTFKGWYLVGDDGNLREEAYDFTTPVTDDINLVAQWEQVTSNRPHYIQPTTENKAESPKTFDAGVAIYGVMAVSSVLGMGYVGKKKF